MHLNLLMRLSEPLMITSGKLSVIADTYLPALIAGDGKLLADQSATKKNDFRAPEQKGIAVVPIEGTLVSKGGVGSSGITGYSGLENRINALVSEGHKSILFRFDTPGGEIPRCFELGKLIAGLPERGVRTAAYIDGGMNSAGYALGAGIEHIVASDVASAGSVGVIGVLTNASEHYKTQGVKHMIIRSGARKALGHPLDEEISSEVVEAYTKKIDALDSIFKQHVTELRPALSAQVLKDSEGDSFIASEALEAGFIDKVGTLSDACDFLLNTSQEGELMKKDELASAPDTEIAMISVLEAETLQAAAVKTAVAEAVSGERVRVSALQTAATEFGVNTQMLTSAISNGLTTEVATDMFAAVGAKTDSEAELAHGEDAALEELTETRSTSLQASAAMAFGSKK